MAKVMIYVAPNCPFCVRAKSLFDQLGMPYTVVDISTSDALRQGMVERAGGRTSVPQIFIDDALIGGCDDLYALHKAGGLDRYRAH